MYVFVCMYYMYMYILYMNIVHTHTLSLSLSFSLSVFLHLSLSLSHTHTQPRSGDVLCHAKPVMRKQVYQSKTRAHIMCRLGRALRRGKGGRRGVEMERAEGVGEGSEEVG